MPAMRPHWAFYYACVPLYIRGSSLIDPTRMQGFSCNMLFWISSNFDFSFWGGGRGGRPFSYSTLDPIYDHSEHKSATNFVGSEITSTPFWGFSKNSSGDDRPSLETSENKFASTPMNGQCGARCIVDCPTQRISLFDASINKYKTGGKSAIIWCKWCVAELS